MATLWQMLVRKFKGPKPLKSTQILNPLKAKIGSSVIIDILDYREMTFFTKEINEVSRIIGTNNYPFTDYVLLARPIGKDDVLIKMRLMPASNDDLAHNVVLLQKYDEIAFDQGFRDLLNDEEFVISKDNTEIGRFWRINNVKNSYKCKLKVVNEQNENPEKQSVSNIPFMNNDGVEIEYWDYWREFPDEAGQQTKEFLFIEMESSTGYFTLWKGFEINTNRIDVR